MTTDVEPQRALSVAIGRALGLLRQARGIGRRELAKAVGLAERELRGIEEGTGEASPVVAADLLDQLRYDVEDLMLVLLATADRRRTSRAQIAWRLDECLALRCGNRDRPLSELLTVRSVLGLRQGITWSVLRVLERRLWRKVEL